MWGKKVALVRAVGWARVCWPIAGGRTGFMESQRYPTTTRIEYIFRVPCCPSTHLSVHLFVHPSNKHLLCSNLVPGSVQLLGIQQAQNQTEISPK